MLQIITSWNLSRPDKNNPPDFNNIKLRGYNDTAFLTGEFARNLADGVIRPLSVSNIADAYCPTRRDFYFAKGVNRPRLNRINMRWGQKVGYLVEESAELLLLNYQNNYKKKYATIRSFSSTINNTFKNTYAPRINEIRSLEKRDQSTKEGDTDWLLTLLEQNLRIELTHKHVGKVLRDKGSIELNDIKIKEACVLSPLPNQIGISAPSTPDFIILPGNIVGDIKSGTQFEPYYQLTCAGYALAYENANPNSNINWGAIFFFPTRNPSLFVRPITFPRIYFFPIDDPLRNWFISERDEKYVIGLKQSAPDFPKDTLKCASCKFKEYCESQGLRIEQIN